MLGRQRSAVCLGVVAMALCWFFQIKMALAQPGDAEQMSKTEVVIIGGLHQFHFQSKHYRLEVLKEIIVALRPDAVLNELPLSQVDENGRPIHREPKHAEGWAADQAAQTLGIPQIPFDRPDREEHFKETKYGERMQRRNDMWAEWVKQVEKDDPDSVDLQVARLVKEALACQMELVRHAPPEMINSDAHDRIIRIKHTIAKRIMPALWAEYPGYERLGEDGRFVAQEWEERNRIMAGNILKAAAAYPGRRLVVVTGAEHRYILREFLSDRKGVDLKEYWELVNVDPDDVPVEEWVIWGRPLTEEQAAAHARVAKDYWEAVIGADWERVSALRPILSAQEWASKHSKNPAVALLHVGQPDWLRGCTCPVVPCRVKFKDGKVLEVMLVVEVRDVDGRLEGRVPATVGPAREVNSD